MGLGVNPSGGQAPLPSAAKIGKRHAFKRWEPLPKRSPHIIRYWDQSRAYQGCDQGYLFERAYRRPRPCRRCCLNSPSQSDGTSSNYRELPASREKRPHCSQLQPAPRSKHKRLRILRLPRLSVMEQHFHHVYFSSRRKPAAV
jgi:hypothetical protein